VNARWSDKISVLVADYLLADLYLDLASEGEHAALEELTLAVARMCEGELSHAELNPEAGQTRAAYIQIAADKTGSLLRAACRVGAHTAGGSPAEMEALGEYGEALGIAFQIVDDLLDLTAQREALGKPVLNDVRMRRLTLPLLYVLSRADGAAAELRDALGSSDPAADARIAELARTAGGVACAADCARGYAERARQALAPLPGSVALEALKELSEAILARAQ
jgi:octaprenyl-diphosphate synthase